MGSGNAEFTVTVATLEEDIGAPDGVLDYDRFGPWPKVVYQFAIDDSTFGADGRRCPRWQEEEGLGVLPESVIVGDAGGERCVQQFMEDSYQTAQSVLLSADVDMVYRAVDVGIVAFANPGSFQYGRWGDADGMEEEEGLLVKIGQEIRRGHIKPKLRVCRELRVKRFGFVGYQHDDSFGVAPVQDSDAVWCGCLNATPAFIAGAVVEVKEQSHLAVAQCLEFYVTALTGDVKATGAGASENVLAAPCAATLTADLGDSGVKGLVSDVVDVGVVKVKKLLVVCHFAGQCALDLAVFCFKAGVASGAEEEGYVGFVAAVVVLVDVGEVGHSVSFSWWNRVASSSSSSAIPFMRVALRSDRSRLASTSRFRALSSSSRPFAIRMSGRTSSGALRMLAFRYVMGFSLCAGGRLPRCWWWLSKVSAADSLAVLVYRLGDDLAVVLHYDAH